MILYRKGMPEIDLHGEDKIGANIKVRHFIDENHFLKNREFAIVHGIGTGTLRKEVWEVLRKDKRVTEFCMDPFNAGCTLVQISIN